VQIVSHSIWAATMPQEVLLTTSSTADSSILLHDLHTSNHIQSFRQSASAQNGLTTLCNRQFLAAQVDRGIVHVYNWGKDAIDMKMILPEKICSLKMSPSGTWCLGGSESGRLFVWETASGNLMFGREAHYQPLTQIAFTADETLVFTGGEDAAVHTWRTMDLVDLDGRSEEVMPVHSWNDHSLAVTGVVCGSGTAMNARVFTSSLDQTVKVSVLVCG
jgi:pre-rRNA-processing protein IPI3